MHLLVLLLVTATLFARAVAVSCSEDYQCGNDGCCISGACRPCGYRTAIWQLLASYILFALGGIMCVVDIVLCVCICRRRRGTVSGMPTGCCQQKKIDS